MKVTHDIAREIEKDCWINHMTRKDEMLDKAEMKFFIEDIQSEEVVAFLAVRISEFSGETLSGAHPSHVATITCNPPEGWSDSDRKRIDVALHDIADVLRARFAAKAG